MDAGRQAGRWQMPGLRADFPIALDRSRALVSVSFVARRASSRWTATPAPVGTFAARGDADDVYFDAKRRRIYVSCGDGSRASSDLGREAAILVMRPVD